MPTQRFFDSGWKVDNVVNFDDFGQSCYGAVAHWKLGDGNKGGIPDCDTFALRSVVLTGDVSSSTTYTDKVVYVIDVPDADAAMGLSELGLYDGDGNLFVSATFPDLDKLAGVALQIIVTVSIVPCTCEPMETPPVALGGCTGLDTPVITLSSD